MTAGLNLNATEKRWDMENRIFGKEKAIDMGEAVHELRHDDQQMATTEPTCAVAREGIGDKDAQRLATTGHPLLQTVLFGGESPMVSRDDAMFLTPVGLLQWRYTEAAVFFLEVLAHGADADPKDGGDVAQGCEDGLAADIL